MTHWEICNWGDLATLEYGKGLRNYQEGQGKYPVYGTNGPIGWHTEALWPESGIIVGRKGAYRGIHFSEQPFYVIDTAFYLKPKKNKEIDIKWAYYALLTQDINGMDSGSAIPSTSRDEFYNLPVALPPLPEQKAIVRILGSLDDKIELNRRMNATLESLAQTLFKAWFVDFEPVKAKAAGLAPVGMDAETSALFPSEFEESALGLIPKGWSVTNLGSVADVNWGDTKTTKKSYVPSGYTAYSASGPDGFLSYYDFDKSGVWTSPVMVDSWLRGTARSHAGCCSPEQNVFVFDCRRLRCSKTDWLWPVHGFDSSLDKPTPS